MPAIVSNSGVDFLSVIGRRMVRKEGIRSTFDW